jgi:small neutral amino acid transporter SnatA (MarC family)
MIRNGAAAMELESLNWTFVIDTFLLLLIGIGPKIALVPFLEATKQMPQAIQRRVLRKMLTTAATVALLLLILGGLLTRLLHFSPGALGVASGIILLIITGTMVLALDVVVFRWAVQVSSHLDASRMLVTEKVFGFLLAALGVQLALDGLADLGVIHLTGH